MAKGETDLGFHKLANKRLESARRFVSAIMQSGAAHSCVMPPAHFWRGEHMRFKRIVTLFLTLAVPCAAHAQQSRKPRSNSRATAAPQTPQPRPSFSPAPPRMSREKAFYYFVAMYGFGRVLRDGGPDDIIELYGEAFDANNYKRAMADEFERNRYKERIRARIADEVRKIDFSEKFTFVAEGTLGEYSFGSHSFPFVRDLFQEYHFCIAEYSGRSCKLDVSAFSTKVAVNRDDFNWSVPMSETDAGAFVKSRSTDSTGKVDRRIAVRITYSVVNKKGQSNPYFDYSYPIFFPFIYSAEAYADESLTKKLGVIPKINSQGPSTAEELRLTTVAAQTATKEIGKYRYMTYYRDKGSAKLENPLNPSPPRPQLFGTITLTDVGVTLFDEQPDGSSEKLSKSFFDLFALVSAEHGSYGSALGTHLWRANYTNATWGGQDFRVVWPPFWKYDHNSALRFESLKERDRFFVDLANALQEWKTKYAAFQFAAGKVTIEQRCEVNTRLIPCSESAPFEVISVSPESTAADSSGWTFQTFDIPAEGLRVYLYPGWKDSPLGGAITIEFPGGVTLRDAPEVINHIASQPEGIYIFRAYPVGSKRQVRIYNRW